jgi:hypothetical protein
VDLEEERDGLEKVKNPTYDSGARDETGFGGAGYNSERRTKRE